MHNFSLVHDDIQDRDDERHHRPTVWRVWGEAQAINAGDALRELGQMALSRAGAAGADAATVLAAGETLNRCALNMIEGQYLDLEYETRRAVGVDEYLTMVEHKTGALLGCSLALGALLAGGDRDVAARLEHAGRCLGLAFQIRDDALGIWGDSSATGKSSDSDIRRRKKSFPIVYALDATAATVAGRRRRRRGRPRYTGARLRPGRRRRRGAGRRRRRARRHPGARHPGRAGGGRAGRRRPLRRLPRGARRLRPARAGPGGARGGGAVHRAARALGSPP